MPITERNPNGTIKSCKMSTEEASRIGKLGGLAKAGNSRDQLLKEAGYDKPDEAPESKKLLALQAAKGNVPSIKTFLSRDEQKEIAVETVQPGERCPTCKQYVLADLQMAEGELESVVDGLDL